MRPTETRRLIRTIARMAAGLFVAVILAVVASWWASRPATPDAFYAAPDVLPSEPGALIRMEPFEKTVPAGVHAWRILYSTTRHDGSATIASAVVATAETAPPGPRPVVAWSHGTTGVAVGCAPSVMSKPFAHVPAFAEIFREGWIYVGTDYAGLGASGGHAYLVGEEAARAVLDAVRAARRIPNLDAADRTVVWGHSQGGNSALWTGILAPTYAADVKLAGVAALAPASDLPPLVVAGKQTIFGRIVSAFLMKAYGETYPDVRAEAPKSGFAHVVASDIAERCVGGIETFFSVAEALVLPDDGVFARLPTEGALGARLRENTPRRPISVPVLIAQGEDDDLVLPAVQAGYVTERCTAGEKIDGRTYAGRDHLSLVAPGSPAAADLVAWTRDRLAGREFVSTCPVH